MIKVPHRDFLFRSRGALIASGATLVIIVVAIVVATSIPRGPNFAAIAEDCENSIPLSLSWSLSGTFDYVVVEPDEYDDEMNELLDTVTEFITVANDGQSMRIDSRFFPVPDRSNALDFPHGEERDRYLNAVESAQLARDLTQSAVISCVHTQLSLSDSVRDRMNQTRALDGTQSLTHKGIFIEWTYHPNVGLNILYALD